jgi:hypothetical protein
MRTTSAAVRSKEQKGPIATLEIAVYLLEKARGTNFLMLSHGLSKSSLPICEWKSLFQSVVSGIASTETLYVAPILIGCDYSVRVSKISKHIIDRRFHIFDEFLKTASNSFRCYHPRMTISREQNSVCWRICLENASRDWSNSIPFFTSEQFRHELLLENHSLLIVVPAAIPPSG